MPTFTIVKPPTEGTAITRKNGRLVVPDNPIIPFIEGDGTGPDIWRASVRVLDAAVAKAYGGARKFAWMEVYAGEKSMKLFDSWLPDDTVEAFREYYVGIKGPLTTPVGGGIRSLNVALRQMLDLYVCLRPVRWYKGVPSPVKHPEKIDMVIFRENTEDIYAGIEYAAGTAEAKTLLDFFEREFPKEFKKIRFGTAQASVDWQRRLEEIGGPKRAVDVQVGLGLKAISCLGSERLVHSAIEYAIAEQAQERDARPQGQHHEVHRRRVPRLGIPGREAVLRSRRDRRWTVVPHSGGQARGWAGDQGRDCRHHAAASPDAAGRIRRHRHPEPQRRLPVGCARGAGRRHRDRARRQHQLRLGHAIFEATHGTAPKYADLDKVNPGSVILSGEMMLRHLGWPEAADLVVKGMDRAIAAKTVTYDFARQMDAATEVSTSKFADAIISHM